VGILTYAERNSIARSSIKKDTMNGHLSKAALEAEDDDNVMVEEGEKEDEDEDEDGDEDGDGDEVIMEVKEEDYGRSALANPIVL